MKSKKLWAIVLAVAIAIAFYGSRAGAVDHPPAHPPECAPEFPTCGGGTSSPRSYGEPQTYSSGTLSFSTSSGVVSCDWTTQSSTGVGPLITSGPYTGAGGVYSVAATTDPCERNGSSVHGTGAGQYYMIFAFQLLGGPTGCQPPQTFTSYPAYINPTPAAGFSYQTPWSPTCFGRGNVRTLVAACAGNGGSCTFPVIGHTAVYDGWPNPI